MENLQLILSTNLLMRWTVGFIIDENVYQ